MDITKHDSLENESQGNGSVVITSASLTIVHFNDVYNIESRSQEPVGGAARFMTAVSRLASSNPLVLFSGDAFNPSISTLPYLSAFRLYILRCTLCTTEMCRRGFFDIRVCLWSQLSTTAFADDFG